MFMFVCINHMPSSNDEFESNIFVVEFWIIFCLRYTCSDLPIICGGEVFRIAFTRWNVKTGKKSLF